MHEVWTVPRGRPPYGRASRNRPLPTLGPQALPVMLRPGKSMLKTIDRYVIREVVPPFVLSLLIFTFVLELPQLMGELERLLAKGVPWPTVGTHHPAAEPAGARADDPHGAARRAADRPRQAVDRPRVRGAPGVRRQPVPAPAPGHGALRPSPPRRPCT